MTDKHIARSDACEVACSSRRTGQLDVILQQIAKSEREQQHPCVYWAGVESVNINLQHCVDSLEISKSTVAYHLICPFDVMSACSPGEIGRPNLFEYYQLRQ